MTNRRSGGSSAPDSNSSIFPCWRPRTVSSACGRQRCTRWISSSSTLAFRIAMALPSWSASGHGQRCRSSSCPSARVKMKKVKLLDLGADDYVVKPFGMAELLCARAGGVAATIARSQRGTRRGAGRFAGHRSCGADRFSRWRQSAAFTEGVSVAASPRAACGQCRRASASVESGLGRPARAGCALP